MIPPLTFNLRPEPFLLLFRPRVKLRRTAVALVEAAALCPLPFSHRSTPFHQAAS